MRASKGALTHEQIMRLSWRQFWVYIDAFTWLLREESEDGRKENRHDDLQAMTQVPGLKERKKKLVEETKRAVEPHKKFAESNPQGGVTRDLLS